MLHSKKSKAAVREQSEPTKGKNLWCHILAVLFALFMVLGRSFEKTDSWDLVFGGKTDMLLSLVQGICWYVIFFMGIYWLYGFWDRFSVSKESRQIAPKNSKLLKGITVLAQKYTDLLTRAPVRTVFCTLMIVNIPYMILSYPGIFMGDTWYQISQGYFNGTALTNHHPIVHTLFLSLFLHIGEWVGSCNVGIFLYCLAQTMFLCLIVSYAVGTLIEIKANKWITAGIVLYYCIHPRISAYFFLVAKDVMYTAFVVLFYVMLFKLLQTQSPRKKQDYIFFIGSIVGMILFRNDGMYVVLLTLLAALFHKRFRKAALAGLAAAIVTSLGLSQVLFPLLDVSQGSIREMLSVPFQQTARYVKFAEEDISDSEREVIDRVLDYDVLADSYDPDISDPVKSTYHGSKEDLIDYVGVWFKMLLRRPDIYIQATMNNYYQYFYPGGETLSYFTYEWGKYQMEGLNESLQTDFHMPEGLSYARNSYEALREDIFNLPVLSLLKAPAFYIWIALLFMGYCLRKKSLTGVIYCCPMFVQLLIFITGPTNGYYCRYEYPMFIYLPVVILLGLKLMEKSGNPQVVQEKASR